MRKSVIWSPGRSSKPSAALTRLISTPIGTANPSVPSAMIEEGASWSTGPCTAASATICRCRGRTTKRTVEIRETTTGSERVHVIGKGQTDSAKRIFGRTLWAHPWGHALAYRVVVGKAPPDGTAKGFSRRLGAGHALSMIHFWQIPAFNWFERVRAGRETAGLRLRGPYGEDCIFMADGSITRSSRCPVPCAESFDPRLGHKNRDINPFQYPPGRHPNGGWSWRRVNYKGAVTLQSQQEVTNRTVGERNEKPDVLSE